MLKQKKCIPAFLHVSVRKIVGDTRAGSTVFRNANTFFRRFVRFYGSAQSMGAKSNSASLMSDRGAVLVEIQTAESKFAILAVAGRLCAIRGDRNRK